MSKKESEASCLIECEKGYAWNASSREYIVFLKNVGKNVIVPEVLHKNLMKAYIEDMPLDEMAVKFTFPASYIPDYKTVFGWKRRGVPITDEEAIELSVEDCADKMLEEKKFDIIQEFNKKSWKATQKDAEQWNQFKYKKLDPFEQFIQNWQPPVYTPVKYSDSVKPEDKYLILGVSDIHFGLFAEGRYLYHQKEWSIDDTKKCIKNYGQKVRSLITNRKLSFKEVKICFAGDIIHGINGYTDKGTKLDAHPIGQEQLEQAYSTMVLFLQEILSIFPKISVYSVPGNHSSMMDCVLARMLEIYFRTEKRMTFEVTSKRFLTFKVLDSLFLLEHGYAAYAKSRLPAKGNQRNNYVNELFLSKPELLQGVKNKYYLSADQHHSEVYEENSYEGVMFPTIIGGCRYADDSKYKSRQRQTGLVITKEGLSEILFFYFD